MCRTQTNKDVKEPSVKNQKANKYKSESENKKQIGFPKNIKTNKNL
jgi:hypothetical protein